MELTTEIDLALFVMRVSLGLMLAAHGYAKVFRGGRLTGTAGWFDSIGMRPGRLHAPLAAFTEIGAGLAMALGLLTSFAAAGFVGLMVVAGWTVHRANGFFIIAEGWEYTFIIGVVAAAIATIGPGGWSIDRALDIDADLDGWLGLGISAGGGTGAAVGLLAAFFRPSKA